MKSPFITLYKTVSTCLLAFLLSGGIQAQTKEQILHDMNSLVVNTVMDDLFTPPVSSRIYCYPNIAFYECIRQDSSFLPSLEGKLNGLTQIPYETEPVDHFISAVIAYTYVAQSLVGSEYKIENWRTHFSDSVRNISDSDFFNASYTYGKTVADSIIAWVKRDNYAQTRGMSRFVLSHKPGTWIPTPLEYAQALEPNWRLIRSMTLRKPDQFSPAKKLVYSPSRSSEFFKNVMEVYKIRKNLDSNRTAIAWYWDDNPNISVEEGHLMYFIHKISPAGHWIMITRQACLETNVSVAKASQAYTLTSIAMFDAFIACWHEKYATNLIRPISIINQQVDQKWTPLIQTPPFPEFTSGHAVLSNAAATVLTHIFGNNYQFTDNTEIPFGIKPRTFSSFLQASEETSWSRVYGGIHYPETCRISITQGKQIGSHVLNTCLPPATTDK